MKKIKIASVATSVMLCLSIMSFAAAPANAAADRSGKVAMTRAKYLAPADLLLHVQVESTQRHAN